MTGNTVTIWLYTVIGGFVAGVAFRSFVDLGSGFAFFVALLGAVVGLYAARPPGGGRAALLISVALFCGALGIVRFDIADRGQAYPFLDERLGETVEIEGMVVFEPDRRDSFTQLVVDVDALIGAPEGMPESENAPRALVRAGHYPEARYGDRIRAKGELSAPQNFVTDTGREFNYIAFLKKDGIEYQLSFAHIEILERGEGNPVKHGLFAFKSAFLDSVGRVIPEPQASLLGGLVVGAKQSLGSELQEMFRETGIIHIVVLSGYNVTIVADAIQRFFGIFLPKVASMSLGGVAIVLFAIMTGASATIVRASIMAILVIIARATGRVYLIMRALMVAGFAMVLHNPYILIFDPSFQLSFLATIGLIYLAPKLEAYFKLVPTKWQLREFATATIATQIFVLPLLLYMTGMLSIVALPVNLLILAFVPVTMLFGFITGIVGFVSPLLSLPFAYITTALLSYELKVVEIFAALPFASVTVEAFPLFAMIGMYALYGAVLWRFVKNRKIGRIEKDETAGQRGESCK